MTMAATETTNDDDNEEDLLHGEAHKLTASISEHHSDDREDLANGG